MNCYKTDFKSFIVFGPIFIFLLSWIFTDFSLEYIHEAHKVVINFVQ